MEYLRYLLGGSKYDTFVSSTAQQLKFFRFRHWNEKFSIRPAWYNGTQVKREINLLIETKIPVDNILNQGSYNKITNPIEQDPRFNVLKL